MLKTGFVILWIFIVALPPSAYAESADNTALSITKEQANFSPYQVRVIAVSTRSRAELIAAKLKSLLDHDVYVLRENDSWAVQVGELYTEDDARDVCRLLSEMGIKGSRMVFDSEEDSPSLLTLPAPESLNLSVIPTEAPVVLDGILDEAVWQQAEGGTEFWQFFPRDRAPATERTVVKVLQDGEYLYFGIICYDRKPDKIVAKDMRRDSGLGDDDYIGLYLDTYHDHRNFYYFSTNPLGTRRDGVVTDANYYNTDWDGIWECKSARTDNGWSTEFRIPFSTLRFSGKQPMTWGFNMSRQVRRKQEKFFWAPIPRELGQKGTWRGELFGQLVGIRTSESTRKLEVEPYMLSGGQRLYNPSQTNRKFNYGGDIRYHFTPNFRGDISLQTDFAQVEADQEIVNFTRWPIRFPEKREFFLENAGLFTYGFPGDVQFFYSRKIGLSGGREVPILGAAKLSGRLGDYSVGIMSVQTQETGFSESGDTFREPETNYSVVRVKRDIFTNGSIGAIVTNKEGGPGRYNRLIGIDGNIWFTSFLKGEAYLAKSFTPGLDRESLIGVGRLYLAKNNFTADLRYYEIAPDYNPGMGYVGATNLTQSLVSLGYTQWVNARGIRNVTWSTAYWYDTQYNHVFWLWWLRGGASVTLNSGDVISFRSAYEVEDLHYAFDIGLIHIADKDYTNQRQTVSFSSNPSRLVSGSIGYTNEDFWDGKRQQVSLSHNFHPVAKLSVDLIYAFNNIDHPQADYHTNTLSNRILYAFNTDLFAKTFVQWNDFDKRISANFLLSYMYRPGSDIYLVYNEIRDRLLSPAMNVRDRILMLKITYNLRI